MDQLKGSEREGEAPTALPVEGATRAPKIDDTVIKEERGAYRINLPAFEGPFDLLLHLIRKHDLSIHDIEIATLTEEYLGYLDTMQTLDIDLAGEFLMMAAELMHIKSQLLLPVTPDLEDEEPIDPRADLVRRLLEYQRFKIAAAQLDNRNMLMRDVYHSFSQAPEAEETDGDAPIDLEGGNVFLLVEAFDRVLQRIPKETYHAVAVDRVSVSQRIYEIAGQLEKGRSISLESILPEKLTRYDVVITFLSLLEMARLFMITLFQGGHDETMYITKTIDVEEEAIQDITDWQG